MSKHVDPLRNWENCVIGIRWIQPHVTFLRHAGTQAHRGILCYINKSTAHRGK